LVDGRLLRCGYTTGTCAAAAAGKQPFHEISVATPSGETPVFKVLHACFNENAASCAIEKSSGDDPDITDGVLVYANVTHIPRDIETRPKGTRRKSGNQPCAYGDDNIGNKGNLRFILIYRRH
jgi:cobalamin biosynthesis protein CbiD